MTISLQNIYKIAATVVMLGVLGVAGIRFADAGPSDHLVRMIVTFAPEAYPTEAAQPAVFARVGAQVELPIEFMHAVVVTVPEAAVAGLSHVPGVTSVYEDMQMELVGKSGGNRKPGGATPPPQPAQELDWGVDLINADQLWGTETGAGVKVAILDTGVDGNHPDLVDNIKGGVGYVRRESWNNDGNGHGTHVAGTVASVNNAIGYIGVAPEADIYAVQVLSKTGSGYLSYLLNGINWAVVNDMDVISMSLSFSQSATLAQLGGLQAALDAAEAAGVVVVAAGGNDGLEGVSYPAKYPSVVAVGSTANDQDVMASYSNWGADIDIAAPGSYITSTWKGDTYNTISGTSMATPHIAGVAALMIGQGMTDVNSNGKINDEVRAQLISAGVHPVSGSHTYTYGRIDVPTALGL